MFSPRGEQFYGPLLLPMSRIPQISRKHTQQHEQNGRVESAMQEDGGFERFQPTVRIANCEQHFCVGPYLHSSFVEEAEGCIDGCHFTVVDEKLLELFVGAVALSVKKGRPINLVGAKMLVCTKNNKTSSNLSHSPKITKQRI